MVLLTQLEINWDESNKALELANHAFLDRRSEVYNKYKLTLNRSNDLDYLREVEQVHELFNKKNIALEHSKKEGRILGDKYKELHPEWSDVRQLRSSEKVF